MKEVFSLRTVRKKIVMLSKLAGIVLIFSYILSTRLPVSEDVSFLIWLGFLLMLVLGIDYFMNRFITKQIAELLGFQHPQHFIRFFKKQTGTTPREYRLQLN